MKKSTMSIEAQKALDQANRFMDTQIEHASEMKADIEKSMNHISKDVEKKSKVIGRHMKKGLTDIKHDVDHSVKKIAAEMKKPMPSLKK